MWFKDFAFSGPRTCVVNGITRIADSISADLKRGLPSQRKTQREKLALLVATMLDVRSANLMDLAAGLPRAADRTDMRYQWITRLLGNPLVVSDEIREPFAREVLEQASALGNAVVLILDQSKFSDRHQVLMLALRFGERCRWRGGLRRRRGLRNPEGAPGGSGPVAARGRAGPAHGRSLLRHRQPDRLVPGADLGLPVAPEGQPDGVRWSRNDHDGGLRREADVLVGRR